MIDKNIAQWTSANVMIDCKRMLHSVTAITFTLRDVFSRALVEHDSDWFASDKIYFVASKACHCKSGSNKHFYWANQRLNKYTRPIPNNYFRAF